MENEQPVPVPRAEDPPDGSAGVESGRSSGNSRYAVSLSTLVGGAYVPITQIMQMHPQPPREEITGFDQLGGDGDGD